MQADRFTHTHSQGKRLYIAFLCYITGQHILNILITIAKPKDAQISKLQQITYCVYII